ncbi:hypothetical protein ABZ883_36730 [Streptomyces sp. NPDC046977]|uniref:hypothetical protein n=1 Tax=Streptomyces sp. NPDC046977 TaxID=3154703 RepID=UPI00340B2951
MAEHLTVVERIVDATTDTTAADDPALRRGYALLRRHLANPHVSAHGVVAVSRTAITSTDRFYDQELAWMGRHRVGLWLVRSETTI